jgi:hypothetical protein
VRETNARRPAVAAATSTIRITALPVDTVSAYAATFPLGVRLESQHGQQPRTGESPQRRVQLFIDLDLASRGVQHCGHEAVLAVLCLEHHTLMAVDPHESLLSRPGLLK